MPVSNAKKPTYKYQVLVTRTETFQLEVDALSAADACEKLQKKLAAADALLESYPGKLLFGFWNEPSAESTWLVMRTTPPEGLKFLLVNEWTGKRLKALGEAELTDNIEQATKKLLNPRLTPKKRSKTA